MLMMRLLIAGLAVAALAFPQETIEQPYKVEINVVTVPTVVTDRDGNYVNGLKPEDFRLTDNDKVQAIHVDVTYVPISLVVAIQANSRAEPVLPKIQKIGPLLQGLMVGDQGEVAILAFDHRVQVLQDFTADTTRLEDALKKLKPGSPTSRLNDAIVDASRMLNHRSKDHRRILLLISETRDYGSAAKVREALTDVQFDNIIVYSVNINRMVTTLLAKPERPRPDPIPPGGRPMPAGVPPSPAYESQVYGNATNSANFVPAVVEIFRQVKAIFVDNPVEVYTKWSGGREHSFVSEKDLERAIGQIGDELHSEYLISYTPNNRTEGGYHDINVRLVGRNDVKIRTRPGYWIAAKPE